jgi:hypothetical protein
LLNCGSIVHETGTVFNNGARIIGQSATSLMEIAEFGGKTMS